MSSVGTRTGLTRAGEAASDRCSRRDTLHSNDIWGDPTALVKHRSITVLVDPTPLSHYVMDLSILGNANRGLAGRS